LYFWRHYQETDYNLLLIGIKLYQTGKHLIKQLNIERVTMQPLELKELDPVVSNRKPFNKNWNSVCIVGNMLYLGQGILM
jgi:hypothetical protein